jgi:hypothetical protein
MGRRYEWMLYMQIALEIVKEENHDKHKSDWKCVTKSIIIAVMKFIFLSHKTKTTNFIRRD